ncbi:hypothetical protein [Xanthomonas melonis]|uniref:hypothetical protein n=1 Tax=Xanthomonas melonis TaxID=56456 RepID=UPI003EC07114
MASTRRASEQSLHALPYDVFDAMHAAKGDGESPLQRTLRRFLDMQPIQSLERAQPGQAKHRSTRRAQGCENQAAAAAGNYTQRSMA